MHIPDGYLSPQTCAVMYAVSIPTLIIAAKKVSRRLDSKTIPLLGILSAFSFIIMMFNVPVPGGTTAHAIGGTLIAITLGPWEAVLGVSGALLIQAIFFGDGGILAYGANVFNMAIALPFSGYITYKLLSKKMKNKWLAAAIASYVGINVAALLDSIELGIQPLLYHTANGTPLYCPYSLSQSVPAMMIAHLTIAGFAEAIFTGAVFAFLQKNLSYIWEEKNDNNVAL
ncbi:cobalt transporter CbiM [Hippea alviniae]|uniref:cobalt transporter CbiM n=1 Tax=Hippea alviniae TaxID=1279027 RepID=UPI0004040F34|nr:cobalt transporter CbiM [Hippea alviniae]